MNEWYEQAKGKLEAEWKAGKYGRCAGYMKDYVYESLTSFCLQDGEFAQAVVQGGTFEDCMKVVEKGCGASIRDQNALRKAVRFYFPGADVQFQMSVDLCGGAGTEEPELSPQAGRKIISLDDFL